MREMLTDKTEQYVNILPSHMDGGDPEGQGRAYLIIDKIINELVDII